jgi:hypothetical protein
MRNIRKIMMPALLAGSLAVSGCANPLGSLLNTVLGGSGGGHNANFQQAAVNACGNQASQYGRVQIDNVSQRSSTTLRVHGRIDDGYRIRAFTCDFRDDGRIVSFNMAR